MHLWADHLALLVTGYRSASPGSSTSAEAVNVRPVGDDRSYQQAKPNSKRISQGTFITMRTDTTIANAGNALGHNRTTGTTNRIAAIETPKPVSATPG